jgi:hypothetical protein
VNASAWQLAGVRGKLDALMDNIKLLLQQSSSFFPSQP